MVHFRRPVISDKLRVVRLGKEIVGICNTLFMLFLFLGHGKTINYL